MSSFYTNFKATVLTSEDIKRIAAGKFTKLMSWKAAKADAKTKKEKAVCKK